MPTLLPVLALQLALAALANLLVARWRTAGFAALGLSMAVPWALPPSEVGARCVATLFESVWALKVIDQARAPRPWPEAAIHLVAVVDLRRSRRVSPGPWWPGILWAGGAGAVATAAYLAISSTPSLPLQLLGAVVFAYAFADLVDRGVRSVFRLAGLEVEPVQRHPVLARTITEFWGRRWNSLVHRWLDATFFRPVARRGHARLGLLAAFAASAALHAYIALVPLGWRGAAWMGGFFLVQGALVHAERGLRVGDRPWARAWTVTLLLASSPLFTWPVLAALGIRPLPGG